MYLQETKHSQNYRKGGKELFPDLSEWCDVPLLLQSVCGSVDGPRNWDDILKEALFKSDVIMQNPFTYMKREMISWC